MCKESQVEQFIIKIDSMLFVRKIIDQIITFFLEDSLKQVFSFIQRLLFRPKFNEKLDSNMQKNLIYLIHFLFFKWSFNDNISMKF